MAMRICGYDLGKAPSARNKKVLCQRKWCSPFTTSRTKAAFSHSMLHKRLLLYASNFYNAALFFGGKICNNKPVSPLTEDKQNRVNLKPLYFVLPNRSIPYRIHFFSSHFC